MDNFNVQLKCVIIFMHDLIYSQVCNLYNNNFPYNPDIAHDEIFNITRSKFYDNTTNTYKIKFLNDVIFKRIFEYIYLTSYNLAYNINNHSGN